MELQVIQHKIYEIRGCNVMLDFDLAELYQVETRTLNQAVKRNPARFPPEFMFQLSQAEFENWKSQTVMSNNMKQGLRRPPYAFNEQGVAMLSAVLKSDTAIQASVQIMNAFVAMRQYLMQHVSKNELEELKKHVRLLAEHLENNTQAINDLSEDTSKEFDDIYMALAQLAKKREENEKPRRPIGYIKHD